MDKYHIYEEIGKGEFSQVFKGREKKKIEYVAIKRVEKCMMNKVVNEVQMMHKLESPHMLKFHDWYETRNNLWLILEYCTGADLESLLKQDGHLPEQSVRTFGLDMLAALKYMHCMGLLHCDIRPRNFLVDEYGILKLSDFKMAKKVPKQVLGTYSDTPLEQRGSVAYMAPELFEEEGLHSFSSDFWALGCVLYELRRGQVPFGDTDTLSENKLIHNIKTLEPVDHPLPPLNLHGRGGDSPREGGATRGGRHSPSHLNRSRTPTKDHSPHVHQALPSMTARLADLLRYLMEKSAFQRCNWTSVSTHPFWGKNKNSAPLAGDLPSENAYDEMIRDLQRQGEQQLEHSLMREFGITQRQAEDITHNRPSSSDGRLPQAPPTHTTPAGKNPMRPHESDVTPVRPNVPPAGSYSGSRGLSHLTGIGEGPYQTIPPAIVEEREEKNENENEEEKGRERGETKTDAHPGSGSGARERGGRDGQGRGLHNADLPPSQFNTPTAQNDRRTPTPSKNQNQSNDKHDSGRGTDGSAGSRVQVAGGARTPTGTGARTVEEKDDNNNSNVDGSFFSTEPSLLGTTHENESHSLADFAHLAVTTNATNANMPANAPNSKEGGTPAPSAGPESVPSSGNKGTPGGASTQAQSATQRKEEAAKIWAVDPVVESLLLHSSDSSVRPIVGNKAIEAVEKYPLGRDRERDGGALPFPIISAAEIGSLPEDELEQHLTHVYKAMQRTSGSTAGAGTGQVLERTYMCGYLISIASCPEVSNIVLNTNFVHLLLKVIRGPDFEKESGATSGAGTSRGSGRPSSRDGGGASSGSSAPGMNSLRTAACTVLACCLRYATFIQPPQAKHKDTHILPTLVGILKEGAGTTGSAGSSHTHGSRLDIKLKRRAVAALGETLFYVSSQDLETDGAPRDELWSLPSGTIAVLVKCLKNDTDEIVRHYAAKTIENVLSQGDPDFRRKLVTVDVAARLLELSQHGRNEALQASCGMALAHMFLYVTTMEASQTQADKDKEKESARGGSASVGYRGRVSPEKEKAKAKSAVAPGAGARFMVKVLDRGGLPAILETLNDGQPKLQQAYLTIITLLFASPSALAKYTDKTSMSAMSAMPTEAPFGRGSSKSPGSAELRSTRQFFLKSPSLIGSLLSLLEHSGSSVVRGKALLCCQLLCDHHPASLGVLSERRLPQVLLRLLDPLLRQAEEESAADEASNGNSNGSDSAGSNRNQNQNLSHHEIERDGQVSVPIPTGSSAFLLKAALSFVSYVRTACTQAARGLTRQLDFVATAESGSGVGVGAGDGNLNSHNSPSKSTRPSSSPSSGGSDVNGRNRTPPSQSSPSKAAALRRTNSKLGSPTTNTNTGSGTRRPSPASASRFGFNGSSKASPGIGNANLTRPSSAASNASHGSAASARHDAWDVNALHAGAELLRAGVSAAAGHPPLRRLVFADGPEFSLALSCMLNALPAAHARVLVLRRENASAGVSDEAAVALRSAVQAAEQAALCALEAVALLDVGALKLRIGTDSRDGQKGVTYGNGHTHAISEGLASLLPALGPLCSHEGENGLNALNGMNAAGGSSRAGVSAEVWAPDGDVRAVVTSSLRRLLPSSLRTMALLVAPDAAAAASPSTDHGHTQDSAAKDYLDSLVERSVSELFYSHLPRMLNDAPPIPQYSIRMLLDCLYVRKDVADAISIRLACSVRALPALVRVFSRQGEALSADIYSPSNANANGQEGETKGDGDNRHNAHGASENLPEWDPQLPLLLRALWDQPSYHPPSYSAGKHPLLEAGLPAALGLTLSSAVRSYDRSHDMYSEENMYRTSKGYDSVELLSKITPLLDLLYTMLHMVLRLVSAQGGGNNVNGGNDLEEIRQHMQSYRHLTVPLLRVLQLSNRGRAGVSGTGSNIAANANADSRLDDTAFAHLRDSSSRSLGMLFDIFPGDVTEALSASASEVSSQVQESKGGSIGGPVGLVGGESVAIVLAELLLPTSNTRTRARLLKIVFGACTMAPQLAGGVSVSVSRDVASLVLTNPLNSAVLACQSERSGGNVMGEGTATGSAAQEVNALNNIATQVLAAAQELQQ